MTPARGAAGLIEASYSTCAAGLAEASYSRRGQAFPNERLVMNDPIAIVGAACQYPDARNPTELWENILAGRRAFRRLPDCRLRSDDYLSEDPAHPDTTYAAHAALITDYEFDRSRFRVVGSTFRSADMAHWLALDVASRAFADAGFPDGQGLPKDQVGVLVGNSLTGEFSRAGMMRLRWPYVRRTVDAALVEQGWSPDERGAFLQSLEAQYKSPFPPVGDETLAGGLSNTIAGRICNYFDLRGGGYTVDGACASSLLAVANACTALVAGDLDIALAGGVDLSLDPFELVGFAKVGALAKSEMRVYDARSAGFWPGEGCGLVVLMRASDAVAQSRPIYALIRGWGISSDGSGGITRPEVEGQKLSLERAYRRAGFDADTVGYFEGHGTGTSVGDATELETVLSARRSQNCEERAGRSTAPGGVEDDPARSHLQFAIQSQSSIQCQRAAIGSIKANIGHTKAAAGVAGLLKAMLALHHQMLPPSVGWDQPHPQLAADDASIELLRQGQPWPAELPLRAAVSAMGFGGINTHVVLEAAKSRQQSAPVPHIERLTSSIQDAELFLFAGESHDAVARQVGRVASYAADLSFAELTDLAAELARSLGTGPARAAIVASRPTELKRSLDTLLEWLADGTEQRLDIDRGVLIATAVEPPTIGYLFPGQGTTASLDGAAWAVRFPFVRQRYQQATLPQSGSAVATEIAHPAIITASLAGLEMCDRIGIEATVGIGHSLGELAAYHWAGALDESALMRLANARGRAIAERGRPGGTMAGIAAPAEVVENLIGDLAVVISGLNSPTQTVVSGESDAVQKVVERAHAAGQQAVRLPVSHAFHSPLVADAVEGLAPALEQEDFQPTCRPVASTITGDFLDDTEDLRDLLRRQLTSPVRLMSAVEAADLKVDLWIEVGPGHVLRGIVGKIVDTPIVSLDAGGDSLRDLLRAAGAAFVLGAPLRAAALFEDRFTRPFNLDWRAKFFVNPCELAPVSDDMTHVIDGESRAGRRAPSVVDGRAPIGVGDDPGRCNPQSANCNPQSSLDVVRQLVAERAELPLSAVQDTDQLLQDLHFSSIAVGSVVADAARALGLPPPVSPTDYARATVGELATALDELARTGAAAAAPLEIAPPGVDSWVRNFTVELVEQPLAARQPTGGVGAWQVIASSDHPFAAQLETALNEQVAGQGVAVCLPAEVNEQHLTLLLEATRKVIENAAESRFVLVQHNRVGGGWARTLHLEMPQVTTCVLNVPSDAEQAIEWVVAEAAAASGYVEAHYDALGSRRVPVLRLLADDSLSGPAPLGAGDVLLVTGGGKGIAAECALDLAKRYGVRLALLGRSRARPPGAKDADGSTDPQLDENLLRFSAAGVSYCYVSADVTDAAGVRAAIEEIERTLGPVTAVLHGAGGNVPQSLRTLDESAARATLAPKINGLSNILAAVDPARLRLLVTFGSIIARTGLHGEADYALANEWLTALTEDWRADHPHCRCLAVEWSVWSGVGMGERLGRIDALRRQGITPIGPDEGVRILRQLITATAPPLTPPRNGEGNQVAVVVSGRFGDPPTLRHEQPDLPLLRFLEQPRLHVPGVELICDVTLSLGADPYLRDHAYRDTPLLPAVMGLEAMAQVSKTLAGAAAPPNFEDVELSRPITIPTSGNRVIRLAALVRGPGKVEVVLRSDETGFQADHFCATCRFNTTTTATPESGAFASHFAASGNVTPLLNLNPRQDLYGQILFHRGRFQRVEGYRQLSATRCLAEVSPDGQARWFGSYLPETLLLGDPAIRDAAIHAIQACIPHGTILPVGIDRVFIGREPLAGQCYVRAEEREHAGDRFVYDLSIVSRDGRACERWEGLRLQRVDTAAPAARWAEPLLAPYLERRLGELVPGVSASIAVSNDDQSTFESSGEPLEWQARRQLASDLAIAAAIGEPIEVHRRADGKPVAVAERSVSTSHTDALTLSISSARRLVACDVEPVVRRDAQEWNDLLSADRCALARLVAASAAADAKASLGETRPLGITDQSMAHDFDASATRLWSAGECLKKAGLRFDAPLMLRDTAPDHWVVLTAGAATVATWVGLVGTSSEPLAVALLVGGADEVL
ncbi:MAG: type I polyketide synthase [Planctomycetes bacterium]|nr:type I polyketide synthase [Planctomycetota bacterium]